MAQNGFASTMKAIATLMGVVGVIACLVAGVALIAQGLGVTGWAIMLAGIPSMLLSASLLYGFGELLEKTSQNNAALLRMEKQLIAIQMNRSGKEGEGTALEPAYACVEPAQPAREAHKQSQSTLDQGVLSAIEQLESAAQIYRYLCPKLAAGDEDARQLLKILEKNMAAEKIYGRDKNGAVMCVASYVNHGNRVFLVDRSGVNMRCPVCGQTQVCYRTLCSSCGALFRL